MNRSKLNRLISSRVREQEANELDCPWEFEGHSQGIKMKTKTKTKRGKAKVDGDQSK